MKKKIRKHNIYSLNNQCNKILMINSSPNCYAEFIIENYTDEAGVHLGVE
jgi:hypothetical protein